MDDAAGDDEALNAAVKKALELALGELSAMRGKEGEALRADLEARVRRVAEVAAEVEKRAAASGFTAEIMSARESYIAGRRGIRGHPAAAFSPWPPWACSAASSR